MPWELQIKLIWIHLRIFFQNSYAGWRWASSNNLPWSLSGVLLGCPLKVTVPMKATDPENEGVSWARGNWGAPEGLPETAMVLLILQLRGKSHHSGGHTVFPLGNHTLSQVTVFNRSVRSSSVLETQVKDSSWVWDVGQPILLSQRSPGPYGEDSERLSVRYLGLLLPEPFSHVT